MVGGGYGSGSFGVPYFFYKRADVRVGHLTKVYPSIRRGLSESSDREVYPSARIDLARIEG